jgi:gliding motility-associated-like protein
MKYIYGNATMKVQPVKYLFNKYNERWKNYPPALLFYVVFICSTIASFAQDCPSNIDFEYGNFNGWTCYTGVTEAVGTENVITLSSSSGSIYNRHTMYDSRNTEMDPYGNFPVLCPNGSGHSIKLGSTEAGGQAEGISYQFTIPANQNSYSLTYHYAVVFQSPNHQNYQQPRMETEVFNVTDNSVITCASFAFIAEGSSIKGFEVSNLSDTINVLYKKWSTVSVDLSGNAGKTIRLFFKTADCTFRRHFGYAYIDVDSDCSGNLSGSTYCPDDSFVKIVAPYGYESYTWYDSSVMQVLGTSQTLTLIPPPPSGSVFAVKLNPFEGFGCPQTLFSTVKDSLTVIADAGKDALSCNKDSIRIGNFPKTGLLYHWSPSAGLSNPEISNPYATPDTTTNYVLTTTNNGGGCRNTDTVKIIASIIKASLEIIGKNFYCFGHGDSAVLQVSPASKIEWFKDSLPINGNSNKTFYKATVTGNYYAVIFNNLGCALSTNIMPVVIDYDKAGITYPVKYAIVNLPSRLTARPIGQTVLWNPGFNLDNKLSFNPIFRGMQPQLYNINITSIGGCLITDTQLVRTIDKIEIYVPTAFTPNSDGRNDYLHPILRGIDEVRHFRVFNRRGQLLFETKNEAPGWDGNFKGQPQDPQAVVWMLECLGLDGVVYSKTGSAVLIR